MSNSKKKPILITGSHRSGSTWTGRMLSLAPNVAYIHEPFNIHHRPGICKAKFKYHFPYICSENEKAYLKHLKECLNFKYNYFEELKIAKSFKDIARAQLYYIRFAKNRILKMRPLVKDPIAIFSAEWLAKRFNMDVVVLIRHPAAFTGSLKMANWSHPFDHFLQQPLLIKQYLYEYKSEIEKFSKNRKNIVDQAILLWNLIHHVILIYQKNNPNWVFVRHEDLSMRPLAEFRTIYSKLDLDFSPEVEEEIKVFSTSDLLPKSKTLFKPKVKILKKRLADDHSEKRKRNSRSNIWSWQQRLTADEVRKIKRETSAIARKFYSEKDWNE